jgi:hypothetical protein
MVSQPIAVEIGAGCLLLVILSASEGSAVALNQPLGKADSSSLRFSK